MFRLGRCGALLSACLVVALFAPCSGWAKKGKKKESPLMKTSTSVSIKADSELDVTFGSSLKQKSKAKRAKGKDGDYTKGSLEFNGSYTWDRDHFAFSTEKAGTASLTFDAGKESKCVYRNIVVNGEKLHDKEALGPVSIDVNTEAGKLYRVTFESKKVTPAEIAKMESNDGDSEEKADKKDKKDKKKKESKSEDSEGGESSGGGDGE